MPSNSTPAPTTAAAGLAGAIERGRVALLEWIQEGTLITPDAYAAQRGTMPLALIEAERQGELFSLEVDGQLWYVAELLKLAPAEVAAVCRDLGTVEPAGKAIFVLRRHGALGGHTIAQALPIVGLPRVLQLAEAWCQE